MKIGIIGNGFVGKATKLLKSKSIEILVYDIKPEVCEPLGTTIKDLETCELIFICLPTPLDHDSSCYTKILEETIIKIKNPFKIIRSTVPVGFSQSQNCFFMPEFLTEANWKDDFINSTHWVFGLLENNIELNIIFQEKINKLFSTSQMEGSIASSTIYWLTNNEAEFLKLAKNCFLAAKVGIMNELYQFAQVKNINYNDIKAILKLDPRIGSTHMDVPGINNLFGYGGTCFPKDTHSLYSQFQKVNIPSYYFQTSLVRNEYMDRIEREWKTDYWRTTIPTDKKISLVLGDNSISIQLCKKLLDLNHIVIYICNNSIIDIDNLKKNPNFIFKKSNLCDKLFFPKLDFIWNLAYDTYQQNYKKIQTCLLNTMNMLELIKVHKCSILFALAEEIYDNNIANNIDDFLEIRKYKLRDNEHYKIIENLISEFIKENNNIDSNVKIMKTISLSYIDCIIDEIIRNMKC